MCIPVVFIGSYSIVSRQGMGREHVTMLLVAELPEKESRGVFWGFLFCGWLLGCFFFIFLSLLNKTT